MKKLKLLLYIGFPFYGILTFYGTYLVGLPMNYHINVILNPVVYLMTFLVMAIDDGTRYLSGEIVQFIIIITSNLIFWIPIAYYINRFLKNRKKKSL